MAFKAKRPDSAVARIDQGEFPLPFDVPFDPDKEARIVIRRAKCDANMGWDKARAKLVPRATTRIADVQSSEARRLTSQKMSKAQRENRQLRRVDLQRLSEEAQQEAEERVMNMPLEEYAAVDATVRKSNEESGESTPSDFDELRLRVADALIDSIRNFAGVDMTTLDDKLVVVGFTGAKLVWTKDGRVEYLTKLQMENPPEEIARGLKSGAIKVDETVILDGEWTDEQGRPWFWPEGENREMGPGEVLVYYVGECADDLEKGRGPTLAAAHLDSLGSGAGTVATSGG